MIICNPSLIAPFRGNCRPLRWLLNFTAYTISLQSPTNTLCTVVMNLTSGVFNAFFNALFASQYWRFRLCSHRPCSIGNKLLRCKRLTHSSLVPCSAPFREQSESWDCSVSFIIPGYMFSVNAAVFDKNTAVKTSLDLACL